MVCGWYTGNTKWNKIQFWFSSSWCPVRMCCTMYTAWLRNKKRHDCTKKRRWFLREEEESFNNIVSSFMFSISFSKNLSVSSTRTCIDVCVIYLFRFFILFFSCFINRFLFLDLFYFWDDEKIRNCWGIVLNYDCR